MTKHVVIRCDASAEGGIGHVARAVSVALAARSAGWTARLAGDVSTDLARAMVADAGIEVVPAPDDLYELAVAQEAAVVHVDHYGIGTDALAQVRAAGAVLSSMEDGVFGRRPADLVIDSAIGAEVPGSISMTRPDDGSRVVLRGIDYAPMRPEVLAVRAECAHVGTPSDGVGVLVVLGGTDAAGASSTLAAICRGAAGVAGVTVIAPPERWEAIRAAAGDVEIVAPGPEFLRRAARADLVVSAAGTTMWELACIGVPSLMVAVVENQVAGYAAAIERGIARGLGTLDEVRAEPARARRLIEEAAAQLRAGRSWSATGMHVVDGRGAERIVAFWPALREGRDPGCAGSGLARRSA